MPPTKHTANKKIAELSRPPSVNDLAQAIGEYSADAFHFIQEGIGIAAERVHGPLTESMLDHPTGSRHISGQQLCEGLRDFALARWGLMARAVLATWGVYSTLDFGRIVFAMIDAELFQKQPSDSIDDFLNVYDFGKAFETDYQFHLPASLA